MRNTTERDGRSDERPSQSTRLAKSLFSTIPIVLAGSMAMSMNLTAPVQHAEVKKPHRDTTPTDVGASIREALARAHSVSTAEATGVSTGDLAPAAVAPTSYSVVAGDTISSIAGRFGLPTASVLAMNGLGWKSVIFPGQVLTLAAASAPAPTPAPVAAAPATSQYTIVAGDTIARIAARFGVAPQSLLSANGLGWTSIIYAGRTLVIPQAGAAAPAAGAAPVAPVTPAASPAPSAATSHVIRSGDTIAGIAAEYGVTVQAILSANGLGWTSIIYAGRALVIPAVGAPAATTAGITPLTPEMAANARTIIDVGRSLGVSDYGLAISLATAMQESSLRNLDFGDRDSLGLFQQRPSQGWGSPAQVTDPAHSARLFFGGPSNPNRGVTRGLLDIPGWKAKTLTQAAQAVQLSAYPDAYAKWEISAWAWLDQLT